MNDSPATTSSRSFGRTVVAVLVFLIAAWLLFGLVIHLVSFIFSTLVFVVAVVAVVWALKVLL
jgi:hypothetical protein